MIISITRVCSPVGISVPQGEHTLVIEIIIDDMMEFVAPDFVVMYV